MKRGDLVTVAMQGDFGKPRPALVIQSDLFNDTHPSVTVLPLTSEIRSACSTPGFAYKAGIMYLRCNRNLSKPSPDSAYVAVALRTSHAAL
ncbi:MAG: type II toxin-antitoxin system PemK/MazF family toxin [Gammaproteobacteria bacterium]